jgi:hypothetical protein
VSGTITCPYCAARKSYSDIVCPECGGTEPIDELKKRVLSRHQWIDSPWTPAVLGVVFVIELGAAIAQPKHIFGFWIMVAGFALMLIAKGVALRFAWRDSRSQYGDPFAWRKSVRATMEEFLAPAGLLLCLVRPDDGILSYIGLGLVLISLVTTFHSVRRSRKELARIRSVAAPRN